MKGRGTRVTRKTSTTRKRKVSSTKGRKKGRKKVGGKAVFWSD
jgi:hypothetical protein